nr:hypothetical protein [uncultured Sulfurimonas sp.]
MIEIAILFVAFFLRLLPRIILKNSWNSDTYFHVATSRMIRKNNHKIPITKDIFSLKNEIDYPWLFHWFLSFVPNNKIYLAEKTISPFLDTLHVAIAMLFTKTLFVDTSYENIYLMVGILIATSPSFLKVGIGPRAYNATPRVFSQLLFILSFSAIVLYYHTGNIWYLPLSIIFSAAIFLSSKFGIQILFLLSSVLLFFGYVVPFIVMIIGFLFSLLLFRKHIILILKNHFISMHYYSTTLLENFYGLLEQKACIKCYFKRVKTNLFTPKFFNWFFMEQNPWHILLFFMPQVLFILFFKFNVNSSTELIYDIFLASFIIFVLVSFKYFAFIGEAERYLEHTVLFQYILFSIYLTDKNTDLLFAIIFIHFTYYTQFIRLFVKYGKKSQNMPKKLFPLLDKIDKEGALIFPLGSYAWPLFYYLKKAQICFPSSGWNTVIKEKELELLIGNYPYPGTNISNLVHIYNIDYIVTDKNSYDNYKKLVPASNHDKLTLLFETDEFLILQNEDD